jgi:site-specific recombinase XerD
LGGAHRAAHRGGGRDLKEAPEEGGALSTRLPLAAKKESLASPAYLHDRCKYVADLAGLNKEEWHLHRFRDTAATRWLRAGIDVRTVQAWLGHESLATPQKYLEPSRDTEKALSRMRLSF